MAQNPRRLPSTGRDRCSRFSTVLLTVVVLCGSGAHAQRVVDQWALSVNDASSRTITAIGGAQNATGSPNSNCTPEEFQGIVQDWNSWRPATPDAGTEWLELSFADGVYPFEVVVHESYNPGAVSRILIGTADGAWQEVWAGADSTTACPGIFRVRFPSLSFTSNRLRLELDTERVPGYNQIDAVMLRGYAAEATEKLFERVPDRQVWTGIAPPAFRSTSCGDLDNDGWPDVYGPLYQQDPIKLVLLHNDGIGGFESGRQRLPRRTISGTNAGTNLVDIDNDGDLDIYQPSGSAVQLWYGPDLLLRNDAGRFTDVSAGSGLTDSLVSSSAIWWDFDRDGFLDVYIGRFSLNPDYPHKGTAPLLRNQGDGTFVDVTGDVGLDIDHNPAGTAWEHLRGGLGTMVAADFDGDSWPDLYVTGAGAPGRLFLNREGHFLEHTSADMVNNANKIGMAVGDIDNDGDLDIFQASLGGGNPGPQLHERSSMLLNRGGGDFLDVTESVGLEALLATNIGFARLADIDNDGDLDLLTANATFVFLNDGQGRFTEATFRAGIPGVYSLVDFDGDGYLDLWWEQQLFRNRGGSNHYLRLGLVGTASNRDGIGARVIATSGDLVQTRELISGEGWIQDERVVHLGLGRHAVVDRLEIRWPSGHVDVYTDVPADQEIRAIEGGGWHPAPRSVWTVAPPAVLRQGDSTDLAMEVRPTPFDRGAKILSVAADLRPLGGPAAVPLTDLGDGRFRLDTDLTVQAGGETALVDVFVEQETAVGYHWIRMSRTVQIDGGPVSAVLERRDASVPAAVSLSQNYPNPFNPETTIRFDLPSDGYVQLEVFDVAGQRVASLVDGFRPVGSYAIRWDGRDSAGRPLASGIYPYRLTVDGVTAARTLVLLK